MPQELINGYRMHYEVHGTGQPLVMVHGGLGGGEGCAAMVKLHAPILSRSFKLVFYDRRSAGRSDTPAGGYGLENQVQDLRALLERLGVRRAHVLGSSAGGPVALGFAMDYPEMVDSLLLVNTMSYANEPARQARRKELEALRSNEAAFGRATAVEKALEHRQPALRQVDPAQFHKMREINLQRFEGIVESIEAYLEIGDSIERRLTELTMPSLIVHGDADSTIPVECGYQLHRAIPGSELRIIPGAQHGLMTNEAGRVRELILRFLARAPLPAH